MDYFDKIDAILYYYGVLEGSKKLKEEGFELILESFNDGSCWQSASFDNGKSICLERAPNQLPLNERAVEIVFSELAYKEYLRKKEEFSRL